MSIGKKQFLLKFYKLTKFIFFRPLNAWLAARMCGWVVVITLLMKFFSLPKVIKFTTPHAHRRHTLIPSQTPENIARLLDRLLAIDIFIFTPTCWKRAIVLHRYLILSGIETHVVFGVRKDAENKLKGHAWIEKDNGKPFLENHSVEYVTTFTY